MKRVASGILPMIAVDGKGPKPLYRQIYDAYRMTIDDLDKLNKHILIGEQVVPASSWRA